MTELQTTSEDEEEVDICVGEVKGVFFRLTLTEAEGPDNLSPRVLKECAEELAGVLQWIFNMSVRSGKIPDLWKTARIVPAPKKPSCKELHDYRPIALTSVVIKCLERFILRRLLWQTQDHLDPLQFAYKYNKGTNEATVLIAHDIREHLEKPISSSNPISGFQLCV